MYLKNNPVCKSKLCIIFICLIRFTVAWLWFSEEPKHAASIFFCGTTAPLGPTSPYCWGAEITQTHHTRYDSSGWATGPSHRSLPHNTQHLQGTDIHSPRGFRTCNPRNRAATDLGLRPCDHWHRQIDTNSSNNYWNYCSIEIFWSRNFCMFQSRYYHVARYDWRCLKMPRPCERWQN